MPSERRDPRRVRRETLDTGLEVAFQASPPGAASFSATYVGPAGWAYDPPGKEGTSLVVTQLLLSGAGKWDRRALDRQLDRLGATLTRECHPESAEATVWGPADLWRPLLDVLSAVVLEPRLGGSDLERVRRQVTERQLRERSQPDSRAESELTRTIFPRGHPYRLTGLGTAESLQRIHRSDVVSFHRRHFTRDGGLVVVTGGPGPAEVGRVLLRRFSSFAQASAPPGPESPPVGHSGESERRVVLGGRAQVEIRIGGPSIAREAPEYPGVFLANEVLGGRPLLSRLFQVVRESHGLAYHASSELQAMRWGGYWMAGAGTGPERVGLTRRLVQRELERISADLVSSSELDQIRESAIGELPLSLETTGGAHDLAVDIAYHRLPETFLEAWPGTLRELSRRDVRRAAEVGLDAGRAVTVLAGPPQAWRTG